MSEILNTYNLFISSSQRETGTPSNFSIYLPNSLTLNNIIPSQFEVFIDRAQIPFTFHQFNEVAGNIQCRFSLLRNTTTYDLSFNITPGNYNILTLCDTFVDNIKGYVLLATGGAYNIPLSYSYNGDTNKVDFNITSDGITTKLTFSNTTYTGLNLALGFKTQWSITNGLTTTSSQSIDCSPSRSLYITSSSLQQGYSWNAITTEFQNSSILSMIPLEASPLLFITHSPKYISRKPLTNTSISEISIVLRDEQLNEIQGFVLDWSLHIIIYEVRVEGIVQEITKRNLALPNNQGQVLTPEQKTALEEYKKQQEQALLQLRDSQLKKLQKLKDKLQTK